MRTLTLAAVLLSISALAADKKKGEKIDLGIPSFGNIPKGDNLEKPKDKKPTGGEPSPSSPSAIYSVVKVVHGKSFTRSATGATPTIAFEAVTASGNPLTTEKFSTVVRVKNAEKKSADITVNIIDPRGESVMDASGTVTFRGSKTDEMDYTIDWDPTGIRAAGDFQVMVKVAGQMLGTFPLKVVERK